MAGELAPAGVECSKLDGYRTMLGARRQSPLPTGGACLCEGRFQVPVTSSSKSDRRMTSLGKANEIRIARARLKQQLRDGDARFEQILASPPECVGTATVLDLLLAVPKVGPVRASRLLATARVSQTTVVRRLSERQRAELVGLLRSRGGSPWS
jgi:hypothetical protein